MGFQIVLEDEDGSAIESLEDGENVLHRVLPSLENKAFCYLNQIDWYGDTTFNSHQVAGVREELARVVAQTGLSPSDAELVRKLDALAARCQSEPHLYVKFYGD